jgi:hypothetical protein
VGFWRGKLKERGSTEGLGVDEIIILKWVLKEQVGVNLIRLTQKADR